MSISHILRLVWRTPYQSASALLIMIITFFVISLFFILGIIAHGTLRYFETLPEVSAFFENYTEEEVLALRDLLLQKEFVLSVDYVNRDQAFQILQEMDKLEVDNSLVSPDFLPLSLTVRARTLADIKFVQALIVGQAPEAEIFSLEEIVQQLDTWLSGARRAGLIFLALLTVESVLVIVTIIGLRISQRRDEIEILDLLGAKKRFIRKPFVVEGAFYGIVGALMGTSITIILLLTSHDTIVSFLQNDELVPLDSMQITQILPLEATKSIFANVYGVDYYSTVPGVPINPIQPDFLAITLVVMVIFGFSLGTAGAYIAAVKSTQSAT
jgi:cell division transport system permease protein